MNIFKTIKHLVFGRPTIKTSDTVTDKLYTKWDYAGGRFDQDTYDMDMEDEYTSYSSEVGSSDHKFNHISVGDYVSVPIDVPYGNYTADGGGWHSVKIFHVRVMVTRLMKTQFETRLCKFFKYGKECGGSRWCNLEGDIWRDNIIKDQTDEFIEFVSDNVTSIGMYPTKEQYLNIIHKL